jgi:hypothetical protein
VPQYAGFLRPCSHLHFVWSRIRITWHAWCATICSEETISNVDVHLPETALVVPDSPLERGRENDFNDG